MEIIDYDSVNLVLDNKLGWNFGTDTTGETDTVMIVPVLNFDTAYNNGATINNTMQTEQNLLNTAFMQTDTNAADSGARKFIVPEINSVYKNPVFAHNDSMLREHNNITQRAIQTEDSLLQYEQSLKFKRDSLLNERRKLEK